MNSDTMGMLHGAVLDAATQHSTLWHVLLADLCQSLQNPDRALRH